MSISGIGSQSTTNWLQTQAVAQAKQACQGSPTGSQSLFDYLDISDEGQAAADAQQPIAFDPFHAPMPLDEQGVAAVGAKIQKFLSDNGIDTSGGVNLEIDAAGHARVVGDNPQKAQIEQLFVDNPKLRNDLAHASASLSFQQAAEESVKFQAAYAEDPEAAVAQFSYLFDPKRNTSPLQLSLKDGELTAVE